MANLIPMTDLRRRRIDQVLEPEFTADLEAIDSDELRRRRSMCDDLDVELSYYRRVLHGRLDLLAYEMRRRAGEVDSSLIDALPQILAEGGYTRNDRGLPQRAVPITVPDIPTPGRRLVDKALEGDFLLRLPSMSDDDLRETQGFISEVESTVSWQRKVVHDAHDRLQAELAKRYRDGELDAQSLDG